MTETLPERLDRLMREAGYNPRSLSLKAALGATAVRDIIDGRIASPRYQTLQALAAILEVGVDYLATGDEAASRTGPEVDHASGAIAARELPVYGAAEGGVVEGGLGGAMLISSDPIQTVVEPLLKVRSGYGVFVVGESMSPAYEQGDIALVHPSLPPRRGADVILVRHEPDGTRHALLKRLVGWTDAAWRVKQYSPAAEFELSRADWSEIQTVVGKYNGR